MIMKYQIFLVGLFVITLVGCSGNKVEVVEVEGTVMQNGQPLDEVKIMFSPDPEKGFVGQSSQAITDENGKFRLKYNAKSPEFGAEVGWHLITALDVKAENSRDNPIPNRIGRNYTQPTKSGLEFEVKSGEKQTFDIELKPRT